MFFHEHNSWNISKFSFIFASNFHEISLFFRHRFSHCFFHRFFMKMPPKTVPKSIPGIIKNPYFSRPSLLSWFYVDFMLILVTILIHLVPFWCPFGSLRLPFGSLLMPFGSHLVPLGSLLLTLAIDFLTFGASWRIFSYLHVISTKILCKIMFLKIVTENQVVGQPNRDIPKNVARIPTGSINHLLHPILQRPGAEHLP